MTQPVDSTAVQSVTVYRYYCVTGSCDSNPSNTYTVKLGETHHIAIVSGDAFGVRFTGNQVCFSWTQSTETYYPYGLDPTYDSTCQLECTSASRFQFTAVYKIINNYMYGSSTSKYYFVLAGGTDGSAASSDGASTGSAVSSANAVVVSGLSSLFVLVGVTAALLA